MSALPAVSCCCDPGVLWYALKCEDYFDNYCCAPDCAQAPDRIEFCVGYLISIGIPDPPDIATKCYYISYDCCIYILTNFEALPCPNPLSIYPVKGYSVTLPAGPGAPQVSVTDESRRLVFSRLGDKLRIAGTAELNGFDLQINRARVDAILRRALELFPDAGNPEEATFWAGLRPATPSNRPYIGRGKLENFYLNTGHGTLGWTLSCGSARAIADILSKRQPDVKFPLFSR